MENEKYGIELTADASPFKNGLKELSKYVKAFGQGVKESIGDQINKSVGDLKGFTKSFTDAVKKENDLFNKWRKGGWHGGDILREIKKGEDDAKVDVDIDVDSSGFEKQIAYVKKQLEDLKEQIKLENIPVEAQDTYKQLNAQLDETKKKIAEIEKTGDTTANKQFTNLIETQARLQKNIQALQKDPNEEKSTKQYKLEAKYEQLQNVLEGLIEKQKEFNDELDKTEKKSKNIRLDSLFDRSIGKIKRFTYYLLGARSVFSLFMKYQGIYYQYNEQMQYQSELSQNAIALSLAPAFEFLGNMIAYASIGLAKFVELLTGVNVLSKVSTKGIRDYNKSLKETQTLVSGIDEITNLTNPQNLGLASQYKALEDFQKKVAEVSKWFEDNQWIGDIANGLKDIVNYIGEHWDIFKYIIGGALLTSFLGFSISSPGIGLMTLTISLILSGYAKAKAEIDKLQEDTHENSKKTLEKYPEVFKIIVERLQKTKKGTKEWDQQTAMLKDNIDGVVNQIKNGKFSYDEYLPVIEEISRELNKLDDEDFKAEIDLFMDIQQAKADYNTLYDYVKARGLHADMKITLKDVVDNKKETKTTGIGGTLWEDFKTGLEAMFGIKLATGTNYVPYDNYPALLHKGEAVVPAKYNPTIHSQGNDYTNSLLETLILKVDNLANRPNEFNIDGQRLARATYPLLQAEARNYTYNEGVNR